MIVRHINFFGLQIDRDRRRGPDQFHNSLVGFLIASVVGSAPAPARVAPAARIARPTRISSTAGIARAAGIASPRIAAVAGATI
jgi:hypothetical protein